MHGRGEFLAVALQALTLMAVVLAFTELKTYENLRFLRTGDHLAYYRMAVNPPFSYRLPPYLWRVTVPLLARALPFDVQWSFLAITFISLVGTAVLIYYLAKAWGFTRIFAILGMLLFVSMGFASRYTLGNFWIVDAASFLVIAVTIYLIVARHDLTYAAVLALGVTVKENALFVVPLFYTLRAEKLFDRRLAARALLLALPAIMVVVALRLGLPPSSRYSLTARLEEFIALRSQQFNQNRFLNWTTGTFGVAPLLLPLFAPRRSAELFLRFLPFLLLVYLQLLLARDTSRLLVLGFPAIILLALTGARALAERTRINAAWFLLLPLSTLTLTLRTDSQMVSAAPQALVFLVFLGAILLWVLTRRGGAGLRGVQSRPHTDPEYGG